MEYDFLNIRSILIFICILQGLIFAVLLVNRGIRQKTKADLWLALLLVVLSSSLITPLIGFANVYDLNQWLTYFPFSINYLPPVLVWFYVLSLTNSQWKLKRKDLLYLIPTAVYLVFRFTIFFQSEAWKGWFDKAYYRPIAGPLVFATEFIWSLWLLYLAIRHYRKYRNWLDENYSDTEKIKFDWLRNFLYAFTAILLLGALFDFTNSFLFRLSYIQYFYFEVVLALSTYCLAVAGYLRSKTIDLSFSDVSNEPTESRRSLLSDKELERLKEKLQTVMRDERPYLEPTITLTDLTRTVGVNSNVLSRTINQGFGKNFNDFINEYRINEVKSKLRDADDATLLGIAFDSGFNSKATFNRAFKKFTGVSPKEYQDNLTQK
ncbi:MAG: helix-turn-helix domain-containing protein [Pyrinomonadaceae bacterium]